MPDPARLVGTADFDCFHYVPVLYARAAEFGAVGSLAPSVRDAITPLWVMPPVPIDYQTGIPKKSFDQHVADVSEKIASSWAQPAFVDAHQLRGESSQSGLNPTAAVLTALADEGFSAIPVLHEDATDVERTAVAAFVQENQCDVALRLSSVLWAEIGTPIADASLASLVASTGLALESIHLIIDLGDQVSTPANMSAAAVRGALAELDSIDRWKTLTVMGNGHARDHRRGRQGRLRGATSI